MKVKFFTLILLLLSSFAFSQQSLVRYPAIDASGQNIAFSYQGDIWVMNLETKTPIRITLHEAYDSYPTWSPDGKMIAFSSSRFGSLDVFVVNKDGSNLKRLTFHPSNDKVNSWNLENRIIFETRHIDAQVERDNELYVISPIGGNAEKLMESFGSDAIESPDGKNVAFVRGSCRITRQAYQGAANRDIWLFNKYTKEYTQLTTEDYNQFQPKWKSNNELYYISSNGSKIYQLMNLNIASPNTKTPPLTQFKDFGLRYIDYSANSGSCIMESGDQVMIYSKNNQITAIPISITLEGRKNNKEHKVYQGDVRGFAVSPNGKYIATSIHGNIYLSQTKAKDNYTKSLTNDSHNNKSPKWLNDTTLVFISDKNGSKNIFMMRSADEEQSNLFKTLKYETLEITNTKENQKGVSISNNGERIAYVESYGKLVVADISEKGKLSNSIVLQDSWAAPSSITWSPDDKYLAYSLSNLDFNKEIFIQEAKDGAKAVNISMHPRTDASPSWSPDGSKLLFSSIRNYGNYDIWYVWLKKEDWEKSLDEWKMEDDGSKEKSKKKDKKEIVVEIDFEDIHQRLYQLTSLPGNESQALFSKDGKTIYFTSNSNENGKTDLYKINWDKKGIKGLTKGGKAGYGMQLSRDGKYVYMVKRGGKPARLKTSGDKIENIAVKARADINKLEQNKQVFKEGWDAINDGFYDPNFHNNDWKKLGDSYKPLALKASTDEDFRDMFNWLLGEVNASHMGMSGPRTKSKTKEKTALLGIDFITDKKGIKITKILKDSPADKKNSKLKVNDIISHVDGVSLADGVNLYEQLANKVNEPCILQVLRNGAEKEIIIRPTGSLYNHKYNDWVNFNTELVDKYSNGKLGYLHIRAMGWASFEKFERDLMAAGYGKEGIVIDVRFNGGGWTTDYLMAVLTVKQHAYTIPRGATDNLEKDHLNYRSHYAFGERLPFAAWTKPSIALCNQNSYSNAEIFSHAYKANKLGTLVGIPTFGAVISTSSRGLSNGGAVRLPFRAWYAKETDLNMETDAAIPDVIIDIKPDSRSKGEDEQLKESVRILLEQISTDQK